MIEYPSVLATSATPSLLNGLQDSDASDGSEGEGEARTTTVRSESNIPLDATSSSLEEQQRRRRKELRAWKAKISDAQKLAKIILGKPSSGRSHHSLTTKDMLQAIRKFAELKQQVVELERESQLTQKALVATQCSKLCLAKRLAKVEQDLTVTHQETTPEVAVLEDEDAPFEVTDCPSIVTIETMAAPKHNLEEEIGMGLKPIPTNLGVGLLGDVESQFMGWQTSFVQLNKEHEKQVSACQAELELLHARLRQLEHVAKPEDVVRAKAHLEKLVDLVEAFPSEARLQGLQRQLEHSRQAEQATQVELAAALHELEAVKAQEAKITAAKELGSQSTSTMAPTASWKSKTRQVPVRFLKSAKKKVHRLFRLDGIAAKGKRTTRGRSPEAGNSANTPGGSFDVLEHEENDKGLDDQPWTSVDLLQLGSNEEDDELQIFDSSSHHSSVAGDWEDVARSQEGSDLPSSHTKALAVHLDATMATTVTDEQSFVTMTTAPSVKGGRARSTGGSSTTSCSKEEEARGRASQDATVKTTTAKAILSTNLTKAASKGFFSKVFRFQ